MRRGSAERWGPLWGARPADWALSEDQQLPTYEAALQRVRARAGAARARHRLRRRRLPAPRRRARRRAARHRRLRGADRRRTRSGCRTPICASARWRPCPGTTTRSTSSPASTRSSSPTTWSPRCARPAASPSRGAPVVIQVWGPHERYDLEAMKQIARPFLPPRPPDAPPDPDHSEPGVLEALATRPA